MMLFRLCVCFIVLLLTCRPSLAEPKAELRAGYLLVQTFSTYNTGNYGAISTVSDAAAVFGEITGKVDGLEYQSLYYDEASLTMHKAIAQRAKEFKIDLWGTSLNLLKNISRGAFGPVRPEYAAMKMAPDGSIVPAMMQERPMFDTLNPEAMSWFLERYRTQYLSQLEGLLSGYFFNEDTVSYCEKWKNYTRYDYWNNASYSPAVLAAWRAYCKKHTVLHNKKLVDKFPVHRVDMIANGKGSSAYFEGYDVPEQLYPGQKFKDLTRVSGVWKHWYDFLSEQFLNNWIGRIAQAVNELNKNNASWHGVLYFGLHQWSLPYEQIEDPEFKVGLRHRWGAWGMQRGIDLKKLGSHPEIDMIVCETYPPLDENLEHYVREYQRIVAAAGKQFGVMLHRDDTWKLSRDEEEKRWRAVEKYRPRFLVRYPLKHMLASNKNYKPEDEQFFTTKLKEYRQSNR